MDGKMLHERLRDAAIRADSGGDILYGNGYAVSYTTSEECNSLADEIERCYTPNPRFEDGSPVSKGCEVDGGTVDFWILYADGSWELYDADGNELQHGAVDDRVKPHRPAIMSADGKELEPGMTVWVTPEHSGDCGKNPIMLDLKAGLYGYSFGDAVEVRKVVSANRVILCTEEKAWCPASWLTTEPVVLDADGVEFKVGETVYVLSTGEVFVVEGIERQRTHPVCLMTPDGADHCTYADPEDLTHREPDSLEKLRDDLDGFMRDCEINADKVDEFVDRLTALMER